jgi:ribosomal protein S12 methylthiotransferase
VKTKSFQKDKVSVITLGCSKNKVDSEVLSQQLQQGGYNVVHDKWTRSRNIVIINTCGFIDKAKEESIQTIMDYAGAKSDGRIEKLYVTGCLSQRYAPELQTEIPEVDAWFGTRDLPRLLKTLNVTYRHELVGERLLSTPSHFAYLKISEGCNRTCSFCAIPLMRGKHISRPIDELLTEARKLAAAGVKELILIAQELTYYGLDIYKKRSLGLLLDELQQVEGIEWIRLHYLYPAQFPPDLTDAMLRNPKVCPYLDMPLQHASDNVLTAMRRNISRKETETLIHNIRQAIPHIALRTTLLTGHPGEGPKEFDELADFIQQMRFDRLGVFTYSHEENTRAHTLPDAISEEEKNERAARLMEIQEQISLELNQQKIGKSFQTLIDKKEGDYYIGRTIYDSPEVDNEVLIPASDSSYIRIGDFVNVRIDAAEAFDLYASLIP